MEKKIVNSGEKRSVPAAGLYYLRNLFFPRLCICCRRPLTFADRDYLCPSCRRMVFWIEGPFCRICGIPMAGNVVPAALCPDCRNDPPVYRAARAVFTFQKSGREMILRYKYGRLTYLGPVLARWLARRAGRWYDWGDYDLIVPVPLHPRKARERGFDQARLLAGRLSRLTGIVRSGKILFRLRYTPSQTKLSARERRRNIFGAFGIKAPGYFQDKKVLLLDDVFTTGATVNECARILDKGGARRVDVLTAARAV